MTDAPDPILAALWQELAHCHDVLGELNAVTDPESHDAEIQARVDAVLTNCVNPACNIVTQLRDQRDAADATLARVQAALDRYPGARTVEITDLRAALAPQTPTPQEGPKP